MFRIRSLTGALLAAGAVLTLLAGGVGCGDDPTAGPVGEDPDPYRDGCVPYDHYTAGDVPVTEPVTWIGGLVADVDVQNGVAVLGSVTAGLRVVDVTDPLAPRLLGHADSPGVVALDLQGDLLAVAEGDHGFSLWNLADPARPVLLARRLVTSGGPERSFTDAVVLAGDRLFVSGYHRRLVHFDVSDPRQPVERGRLVIDRPGDLAVVGDRVFAGTRAVVAVGAGGRLSVAQLLHHGAAEDLCVADGRLHAAVAEGLVTYDVAGPGAAELSVVPLAGARCLAAAAGRLYLGRAGAGTRLLTFDVSGPGDPIPLADVAAADFVAFYCLAYADGVLLAGDRHLRTVDVADPAHPVFVPAPAEPAYPQGLAVSGADIGVYEGPRVYLQHVAAGGASAATVLECGESLTHAAANADRMYFARATGGLAVVDPRPGAEQVAVVHPGDYFGPLAATDSLLVVGSADVLRLYRLDDPGAPAPAGELPLGDYVQKVAVDGTRVLVSVAVGQLILVDAADPARPFVVAADDPELRLEDSADVAWSDSCGVDLLAGGVLRLVHLDPGGGLVTTAALATGGTSRSLGLRGPIAYLAAEQSVGAGTTVFAVDLADAAHPRVLGKAVRPWTKILQLHVEAERAYGLTPGGVLAFWLDCRSFVGAAE